MVALILQLLFKRFLICTIKLKEMGKHVPQILSKLALTIKPNHVSMLNKIRDVMK
jgi:hypothetical protein